MNFVNSVINITVKKQTYSIYYSFREKGTFQDLFEYFAFLCPDLKICQCYHFCSVSNNQYFTISKASKISEYVYCINNLILYKSENECQHNNYNYLLFSKKELLERDQKQKEKLETETARKDKKIKDLTKENERLDKAISGDPRDMKFDGEIKEIPKPNFSEFYDVIVHIDSIRDIIKGWKIDMNKRGEDNYKKYKAQELLKIGVIGNANKGKSFILSKLSKMPFPSGMSIKTEGLSIKYPELEKYKNRKIVLLDSAGLETPVLVTDENMENEKKNELFREKSREKLITELFLQNYIINNSDILIVVVDSLSFSEQKLLLKVKKEMERLKRKTPLPLYVIHNLKSFTSKKQVEDYIDNTLLKSATFSLKKVLDPNFEEKKKDLFCYYEVEKDIEKSQQEIYHLLYANEESEAGKIFNPYALNFIENSYKRVLNIKPFDVIKTIKERFIELSKDIIERTEKEEKLTLKSFDDKKHDFIKLEKGNEIILKKCLIDELGFSNFKSNGFEPAYNIFKNKENTKFIVRVEVPGNCTIKSDSEDVDQYHILKISGEKIKDKEPEKLEDNIFNMRKYGHYSLEIPIEPDSKKKINFSQPTITKKGGIYFLEYDILKTDGPTEGPIENGI